MDVVAATAAAGPQVENTASDERRTARRIPATDRLQQLDHHGGPAQ